MLAAMGASGCGETYIDENATATTADPAATTTTTEPIPEDATVEELVEMMNAQLDGLSSAIIDEDDPEQILARVNAIWKVLEPKLTDLPTTESNLASAVDFADLAVERKRPADADKAVKIVTDELTNF